MARCTPTRPATSRPGSKALAALGGLGREALHAQLAAALQVLVHVRRLRDGRRWVDELRVVRADPVTGRCRGVPAIRFDPGGASVPGEAHAELVRLVSR